MPDNEATRLDVLRGAYCAYGPRKERITRTAKRLLHMPISLMPIVEQDEQWFRCMQGIEVAHTPRDISFCGHVATAAHYANLDAVTQLLAQVLRQRLPPQGALARLGSRDFCALVPSPSSLELAQELATLTSPAASVDLPDTKLRLNISLSVQVTLLSELGASATPDTLWGMRWPFRSAGNPERLRARRYRYSSK